MGKLDLIIRWKLSELIGDPLVESAASSTCAVGCARSLLCLPTRPTGASSVGLSTTVSRHALAPCVMILTRHNIRTKSGVPPADVKGWAGDILCPIFCGPCSYCQMLRASDANAWSILEKDIKPIVKPIVILHK